MNLPTRANLAFTPASGDKVLIHSGARLPARVWPLERFAEVARRLRAVGFAVQVACDAAQAEWWRANGEAAVVAPRQLEELLLLIASARVFVGNCSGPGHLAAISGVPTFTIFGPSLPGEFLPVHPQAEFIEDNSCAYKPCADYCRFDAPKCLLNLPGAAVGDRVESFVRRHMTR
jgi:ADP-heptose:LPS heptosyltransferase